ncbi:MAG: hypothetical protein HY426_04710 [Candidatus Levybacteria bacterium]|nr:hypothetical protein [Candidatus Levybacteria bacterium]
MSDEDQSTNQGGKERETRSLVVRSEQAPLSTVVAETPFLQQVGFSPLLGQRLARLNEVITSRAAALKKVELDMIPGETALITTRLTHDTGYRLHLESTGEKAQLVISSKERYMPPLALTLADLKTFLGNTFPGKEARFHQFLKYHVQRDAHQDDVEGDISELSEEELMKIIHPNKDDIVETRGDVDINIGREASLALSILDQFDNRFRAPEIRRRPLLYLLGFAFTGKPDEVEQMIDALNPLFDKPEYYGVRYDDPWLSDPDAKPTEHLL